MSDTKKTGVAARVGFSGRNATISVLCLGCGKRTAHRMSAERARLYARMLLGAADVLDREKKKRK